MPQTTTTCRVLLFGPQASLAGCASVDVQVVSGQTTAAQILEQLGTSLPTLAASLPTSRLAVNHDYADPAAPLTGDEELALIGMVSGG